MKTQTAIILNLVMTLLVSTLPSASSQEDHEETHLSIEGYKNEDVIESQIERTARDVTAKLKTRTLNLKGVPGPYPTKPAKKSELGPIDSETGATMNLGQMVDRNSHYLSAFDDPKWPRQWYSQDYRTAPGPVMDHNVIPVYAMGITGVNVNIGLLGSGIVSHPDLKNKIVDEASYNFADGKPGSNQGGLHGTVNAGIIAMEANNKECGVGVAFDAKIIDIKIFSQTAKRKPNTSPEAQGLNHKLDMIDIYSNSWGPADDGMSMRHMERLQALAILKGNQEGRSGKGAIYIFPSGTGKRDFYDNCATDAHVNHAFTLAIASATFDGHETPYSEQCSAIIATVYNKGATDTQGIVCPELNGKCGSNIGPSATVPLATGIIALLLQARPDLTFRDVQHIIARSSEVAPLANNAGNWNKNGAGYWVSLDFGFGLLNAENMVKLAQTWKLVPPVFHCTFTQKFEKKLEIIAGYFIREEYDVEACQTVKDGKPEGVYFLETLETEWTISYPLRGDISITLTSPQQTRTKLLNFRALDQTSTGLVKWPIKSLHTWGENPKGKWQVQINIAKPDPFKYKGVGAYLSEFKLKFRGTAENPTPKKLKYPDGDDVTYAAFKLEGDDTVYT